MDEVAVHHQPAPEPVAARLVVVGDEAALGERREEARDCAGVDPGSPGDLVGAELGRRQERVQDADRAPDGGHLALCWLSRAGHGTFRVVILTRYCRGGNLMASLPNSAPYVVVGAGIHGLSTAYHLAKE